MRELLDKERVTRRSAQDKVFQFGCDFSVCQNKAQQLSALRFGKLINGDLAVKGFASPGVVEFVTIDQQQKDTGVGNPLYKLADEFFRRLIDPLQIIQDQHDGVFLPQADEYIAYGFEHLHALFFGVETLPLRVLNRK